MNRSRTAERVWLVVDEILGYDYGSPNLAQSPITEQEFEGLKQSTGFTKEDEHWLRVAGETLVCQTKELVGKWRDIVAKHPHLARCSLRSDGQKTSTIPKEAACASSNGYLIHVCGPTIRIGSITSRRWHSGILASKKQTDNVESVPTIHLRHIIAFTAVLDDPNIIKPFLSKTGHSKDEVEDVSGMVEVAMAPDCSVERTLHKCQARGERMVIIIGHKITETGTKRKKFIGR